MLPLTRSSEGLRLLSAGQVGEAIDSFQAALEQDPKDLKCLLGLARAQIAASDAPSALATFQRIFAIRPDHMEAKSHLGLLLAQAGDPKGPTALEEAAKDRHSGYVEHLNFGLYLAGRDDERAQREFELALRTETRESLPYLELGKISERKQDLRAALRHYLKASEVARPNDLSPFLMRARAHRALGENPAAVHALMQGLDRLPAAGEPLPPLPDGMAPHALFSEAYELCTAAGQHEHAVRVAMRALEQDSTNADYQRWMSEATAQARKAGPRRATTGTFEAIDASLVDPEALTEKAEKFLFKKPPMLDECVEALQPVLRLRPNDQRANILMGVALASKGLKAQALPHAQKALAGSDKLMIIEAKALIQAINPKK